MPLVTLADSLPPITEENAKTYPLSGTCTEVGATVSVSVVTKSLAVNNPTSQIGSATCDNSGKWSVQVDLSNRANFPTGLAEVTAEHQKGDLTSQATKSLSKMPHVTVIVPDGGFAEIGDSNVKAYLLSGGCSEEGVDVEVKVQASGNTNPHKVVSKTESCSAAKTWSLSMDLDDRRKISTGRNEVTASQIIRVGSDDLTDSSSAHTLIRLPSVTIENLADVEHTAAGSLTVSGTCTEEGQGVSLRLDGFAKESPTSVEPAVQDTPTCEDDGHGNLIWSYSGLDLSGWDSNHVTITATHASAVDAGNSNKDYNAPVRTITLNKLPGLTINEGNSDLFSIDESNEGSYTVGGTCTEPGSPVHVWIGNSGGNVQGICQKIKRSYKYIAKDVSCTGDVISDVTKGSKNLHIFVKGSLLPLTPAPTCSGTDIFTRDKEVCTKEEKDKKMQLFIGGLSKKWFVDKAIHGLCLAGIWMMQSAQKFPPGPSKWWLFTPRPSPM